MKLSYLIKRCTPVWDRIIEPISLTGKAASSQEMNDKRYATTDPEITSIHVNAGEVKPGGLFVAIKGFKADGHDYIGQAIANGAAAIITQKKIGKTEIDALCFSHGALARPVIVEVPETRKAISSIASRFYGNPSDSIVMTGVTGTNGKTTTTFLLESILKAGRVETGVIGTVNYRYGNKRFDNPVTTPESIDLQKILGNMRDAGVTHVVMEVSSHAIDLHRVRDCSFDVGIFTNLTQDHLDYHKTMSAYFSCKKKFFTKQLKKGKNGERGVAVINVNGAYGQILVSDTSIDNSSNGHCSISSNKSNTITIGTIANTNCANTPTIWCSNIEDDIAGLRGNLHIRSDITIPFHSTLTGHFNLENILCATGAAHALGLSPEIIKNGIESCHGVPGRLERVSNSGDRYVFVDYAHTPDALESILKTLKLRAPGRLISVFGCGGDRDRAKRPIMGAIACRYSDIAIVTSDNPRSEDPEAIISQIVDGIEEAKVVENGTKQIVVDPDRAKALEHAVRISNPGDIIVAAGKGHETYQITAKGKIDFDDRVILKDALIKYGFSEEV